MENDFCEECGREPGEGHKPYRGMICETCAQYQKDQQIEKDIQDQIDEPETV